ncbi:MAG TPA: acyl-CoA dehydrogenase family protein [Acidimicrobiia bacterium]|nr:acyl-CoA dehydrogenase family protein [Acidimicrobiia bacterium]
MQLRADLASTPELVKFRDELAAWLDRHLTDEFKIDALADPTGAEGEAFERRRAWQRVLHKGGWIGVNWPAEYGGRGATLAEYAVFLVTCADAGAPEPINSIGLNMVGPTLIENGTPAQQALLPDVLSADTIWCQLFSEPEAGSDLGAIKARARRQDDGAWVVSGQKVWTSFGPVADLGLLLARTGDAPTGFRGLSCFIVDMHAPGVTVRGLRQMGGQTHFSEVFLDDVVLPADAIVGQPDDGWAVATNTLGHERTTAILSRHASTLHSASALLGLAGRPGVRPSDRDRAVADWIEAQLFRLNGYRGVAAAVGGSSSPAAWTQRMQWGLLTRRIFETAASLRGPEALLLTGDDDPWGTLLLTSRGWTIGGGTTEIQRNMLGEKILGLPREPKPA